MTTINASSLSTHATAFAITVKKDATVTTDSDTTSTTATTASDATSSTEKAGAAGGGGGASSSSSSTSEAAIEKLEEQIKETQKRLQEQQEQLAVAQASKGNDDQKTARVMAIEGQIASSSASLATQEAALVQLQKSGSINTTA